MNPPQSIRPGDGEEEDPPKVVDRADLAERRARRAEMGEQMQARRAAEAEALVAELTGELARLEAEAERTALSPARSEERLAEARRALRAAEQRAHAERRRRLEAGEESAARLSEVRDRAARERARADAGREALREAQDEGERLRRRVAEAEHALAAAAAMRRRDDEPALEAADGPQAPLDPGVFRAERTIAEAAPVARSARRAAPLAGAPPLGLESERSLVASRAAEARSERLLGEARELARELATRLESQRRDAEGFEPLRAELERERSARIAAEAALAEQREATARVRRALDGLREELARLRAASESASPTPRPAPQSAPPLAPLPGLAELRDRLGALGEPSPPEPAPPSLSVERLEDARARLRSREEEAEAPAIDPPAEPEPVLEPAAEPRRLPPSWLSAAFARLGDQDPALAGRLAIALLPALGAVAQQPVTFVIDVDGIEPTAVDAAPGRAAVVTGDAPASGRKPEFRVGGSAEALGRLLAAPAVRSWLLAPGRPRLRGRRRRAAVLRDLVRAPLGFADLARLGVELDPELAYGLLARAITPAWTKGHAFTIKHETTGPKAARAFLTIRDGRPPVAGRAVLEGRVAATVACSPAALLPLLAGAPLPEGERATIRGEAGAVALVQGWIARAQGNT